MSIDDKLDGHPDPIDEAIAAVEPEPEHHLIADFKFTKGGTMQIKVPLDFDTDMFETAVGLLMQLRYAADQRAQAMKAIIELPKKPGLVAADGRPIASRS